ncbi:MAG: reductive dehalogenase, partial [Desulfobacterales bacterium]|nr:reductive dehalogenase [Desulfobacterales bacterium]
VSQPIVKAASPAAGRAKAKYRPHRKYRYPWWVETVDQITTETNDAITMKPLLNLPLLMIMTETDKWLKDGIEGSKLSIENIKNNVPGSSLKDFALHYAAGSFFRWGLGWNGRMLAGREIYTEVAARNIHTPQDLGVPRWEGTPEEASDMIEAAGIQLGSTQVAFTRINPLWIPPFVKFDPDADKVTPLPDLILELSEIFEGDLYNFYRDDIPKIKTRALKFKENMLKDRDKVLMVLPERYKYVVVGTSARPYDLTVRAGSQLGAAGDRVGASDSFLAMTRIRNFIKGLGYDTVDMPSMNDVPWAVAAGLGEMGRMNRMISPIFGGNVVLWSFITDLPVAPDKPIDFGLQEFCRNCKKCAEACPAGALSMDKEPSWAPRGPWSVPGKKVYFENSKKCQEYMNQAKNFCAICLSSCPWTKKDKAALHQISRIMGSKASWAGEMLRKMDDAFGYERITPEDSEMNDWWKLNIPTGGIDTWQGKT